MPNGKSHPEVRDVVEDLERRLKSLPQIKRVETWTRIPGKERMYLHLVKRDGNQFHRGGVGHVIYVDLRTGFVCYDHRRSAWAGPRTQAFHQKNRTLQAVRDLVTSYLVRLRQIETLLGK
jgi:hypothetical protein